MNNETMHNCTILAQMTIKLLMIGFNLLIYRSVVKAWEQKATQVKGCLDWRIFTVIIVIIIDHQCLITINTIDVIIIVVVIIIMILEVRTLASLAWTILHRPERKPS